MRQRHSHNTDRIQNVWIAFARVKVFIFSAFFCRDISIQFPALPFPCLPLWDSTSHDDETAFLVVNVPSTTVVVCRGPFPEAKGMGRAFILIFSDLFAEY